MFLFWNLYIRKGQGSGKIKVLFYVFSITWVRNIVCFTGDFYIEVC